MRSSPSNNGTPVQNKETIESEQIEQVRRQNERSVILVNERVTRQEEEQLIDHPSISQSQQLEPNGMPATNSRKSEKSHSSLDQGTHLQPFQMSTGYPEVHRYTPTYAIGERRRDQSNRRIPYEEPKPGIQNLHTRYSEKAIIRNNCTYRVRYMQVACLKVNLQVKNSTHIVQ